MKHPLARLIPPIMLVVTVAASSIAYGTADVAEQRAMAAAELAMTGEMQAALVEPVTAERP